MLLDMENKNFKLSTENRKVMSSVHEFLDRKHQLLTSQDVNDYSDELSCRGGGSVKSANHMKSNT